MATWAELMTQAGHDPSPNHPFAHSPHADDWTPVDLSFSGLPQFPLHSHRNLLSRHHFPDLYRREDGRFSRKLTLSAGQS